MYIAACGERVVSIRDFSAAKDVGAEERKAEKASESVVTPMADFFEARRREGAKDGRKERVVEVGVIGLGGRKVYRRKRRARREVRRAGAYPLWEVREEAD
jgi:hypothetical protein